METLDGLLASSPLERGDEEMRRRILDAARAHLRRHGEGKTTVVDVAKALGTSHTTLYRHFRAKADILDALAAEVMAQEIDLARTHADAEGSAAEKLEALVLAIHASKRARFAGDPEVYALHRSVQERNPGLVTRYTTAMTAIVARLIAEGIDTGEFAVRDASSAADVFRDAVTVFVHPAFVAARQDLETEPLARNVVCTLLAGFRAGVDLQETPEPRSNADPEP